jgi:hypothetical protein
VPTPQAEQIIARLTQGLRQARNDVIVEVTANLMEPADEGGTPVDTGWARANWIPSVGTATEQTDGTPQSVSTGAQQIGIAQVAAYRGAQPVFVSNNVPYIMTLNDGSSKQAPAGFVELAVAKAEQTMQQLHSGQRIDITTSSASSFAARMAGNLAAAYSPFGGE